MIENNIIPTAYDLWTTNLDNLDENYDTTKAMIEFAKLHVQEALKQASEYVEFDEKALIRQSIIQAYPLENIK